MAAAVFLPRVPACFRRAVPRLLPLRLALALFAAAWGGLWSNNLLNAAEAESRHSSKPLWLGDPEVDPEQARAHARERRLARQALALSTSLGEYERVGRHDPRWDADAREALRLYAPQSASTDQAVIEASLDRCSEALQRTLDEGCDDPLIVYLALRQHCYPSQTKKEQLARRYTQAEDALMASGYSPMRKFYACVRALEADFECRHNEDGTVGRPCPSPTLAPAKWWPGGTHVQKSFQHGLSQLMLLLDGADLPPNMYADGVDDFLGMAECDPFGLTEVFEPLEKFFEGGKSKDALYSTKLVEGMFWTNYGWRERGGGWADTVTPEGWKLFDERLLKAQAALESAWKLDTKCEEAPLAMLAVARGLCLEREEKERWFRRAMDANPDVLAAGTAKLEYLEPKWGGSARDMIEFGHQCLATQDWASRMPIILYQAHYRLAKEREKHFLAYWKNPKVWADMQKLFEAYLAANPTYYRDRTLYALCAYRAEDWKVAHEQFELLGDHPAWEQLEHEHYSGKRYQEMRQEAADKAAINP